MSSGLHAATQFESNAKDWTESPSQFNVSGAEVFSNLASSSAGKLGYLFEHGIGDVVDTSGEIIPGETGGLAGGVTSGLRTVNSHLDALVDGDYRIGTTEAVAAGATPTVLDTVKTEVNKLRSWITTKRA